MQVPSSLVARALLLFLVSSMPSKPEVNISREQKNENSENSRAKSERRPELEKLPAIVFCIKSHSKVTGLDLVKITSWLSFRAGEHHPS